MPKYGSYGVKGNVAADMLKRQPGKMVSYNNTKRRPRSEGGDGKLGTVKTLPKP